MALCLIGCGRAERNQRALAPIKVQTMVVAPQSESATSRYVGTIEPVHETPLSMQSAGRVEKVAVKNGQRVRKGQLIIAIDNTQALNAVNGAEAALKHAQDGYERVSKVHEKGVVSDQKMVEVESQWQQAKSLYAAAKKQLNECQLTAPCDGVISGLKVEQGQTVVPGAVLCAILDVTGFNVRFTVPEAEINGITKQKKSGEVECAAIDSVFPITVTQANVTANPVTHTYDVLARVQGGTDVLRSGMVGKIKLRVESLEFREKGIVIPARCVLLKPEGYTVWVKEQDRAVRKSVTVDGYQADGVRVKSGLQPGDTLIIDGYQKLYKNCKVICDW